MHFLEWTITLMAAGMLTLSSYFAPADLVIRHEQLRAYTVEAVLVQPGGHTASATTWDIRLQAAPVSADFVRLTGTVLEPAPALGQEPTAVDLVVRPSEAYIVRVATLKGLRHLRLVARPAEG